MDFSAVVSVVALVISIASAVTTVLLWRLSGPRLKIKMQSAVIVGPDFARSGYQIGVTNVGRARSVVRSWRLASEHAASGPEGKWVHGPETPVTIEPQDTVVWNVDYHAVKNELLEQAPKEEHWVRAVISHGNKTSKSRQKERVSDKNLPPPRLPVRFWRDLSGGLAFVWFAADVGVTSFEQWYALIENKSTVPLRSITVDQVPAQRGGFASDEVVQRRLLLPGRKLKVPVTTWSWPETVVEDEDPRVRVRYRSLLGRRHEIGLGRSEAMLEPVDEPPVALPLPPEATPDA